MALREDFDQAVRDVGLLTKRPTTEELLELYGLFKQSTEGDNNNPRPGGFNFKDIAKHDAWIARKGMAREKAMEDYIALVARLLENYR